MSHLKQIRFVLIGMMAMFAICASAQKTITGTVIDNNGDEVIGATIMEKGTSNGTTTDLNGKFSLKVSGKHPIVVTYIGMKKQEVNIVGKSSVKVTLENEATSLNEVVAIGYGTMKRRDLTGAISTIKEDEIRQAPVLNAMEGLQGKVAGLDITRSSGKAGESPTVLLRGNRSLNADCSPLYVIDGVSGGNIDNLNPNDIESIEVLKDASSTAIYGSAGANGVIIVNTRQAVKGKTQVDFNAYIGINAWPSFPSTLSGEDYISFLEENFYNTKNYRPQGARGTAEYMNSLLGEDGVNFTLGARAAMGLTYDDMGNPVYNPAAAQWVNWKDELIRTGVQQNYNISVRGGTDKTQSYMSAGYQQEKGLYRKDQAQLLTFRAGSTYNVNNIVSLGFQSTMSYKDKDNRSSRLSKSLNQVPLGQVWNEDGSLKTYPIDDMKTYINIMADDVDNVYENNSKSFNLHLTPFIEIKPIKGLSFKSLVDAGLSNSRGGIWDGLNTYYKLSGSQPNIRKASYNTGNHWSYMWQNVLTYNFQINKIHDITVTGITEYAKSFNESGNMNNENFDYDTQKWYNLQGGTNPTVYTSYQDQARMSYAGRIHYSLLGRYLLTASVRRDGSSVLYKDKRWSTFPAVAAAWRISDETFMDWSRNWLDNLKLRIGYGVTGNSNIAPYSSLTMVESSANNLSLGGTQVQSYVLTKAVANYDLTWEKSYNWNLGLDFAVLGNRIDGSIELYTTDTKGVLYGRTMPTVYGLYNAKSPYTKMSNIARIKNKGIEITINSRNIQNKDFQWNTSFTFATNNEKLKEINLGNDVTVNELVSLGLYMNNPVSTLYGYKKVGIWQKSEENQAASFGNYPGDVKLAVNGAYGRGLTWDADYTYQATVKDDKGGDILKTFHGAYYEDDIATGKRVYYTMNNPYSVSSSTDRMILGHKTPDWSAGMSNSFYWKNFDLTIYAFMRWGQMIDGQSNCLLSCFKTTNIPECFDYWTENNPTNAYPRVYTQSDQAVQAMGYVDGSYFKIKNITLGYTFPQKILKKTHLSKLRLYGTITNPLIISKEHDLMKGMDPEANCSDEFPLYRTLLFGVNVSF